MSHVLCLTWLKWMQSEDPHGQVCEEPGPENTPLPDLKVKLLHFIITFTARLFQFAMCGTMHYVLCLFSSDVNFSPLHSGRCSLSLSLSHIITKSLKDLIKIIRMHAMTVQKELQKESVILTRR